MSALPHPHRDRRSTTLSRWHAILSGIIPSMRHKRPHTPSRSGMERLIMVGLPGGYFILSLIIANNCELAQHRLIFTLASLCLPLCLLNCGAVTACLLSIPLAVVMIVNLYIIIHYHRITYEICMAIAGTDRAGAITMLHTVPLTPVLLAVLLLAVLLYLTARAARFRPLMALTSLAGASLALALALHQPLNRDIAGHYNVAISYDRLHQRYVNSPYFARNLAFYINLPGVIGNTLATFSLSRGYQQGSHQRQFLTITPHTDSNPTLLPDNATGPEGVRENIVLIIGESDAASHHGLYGYTAQDTTPNLRHLAGERALCAVAHAHSAASMTHNAVPMMISFLTPQDRSAIIREKNLIELAHDHGFATLWLGTHEGTSLYNSPFGYLSEFSDQLARPDHSTIPLTVRENDDESLLPALHQQLGQFRHDNKRHFIIIHLIGSHAAYREKTTPADRSALPQAGSYDQSIHHTDHILASIITMVEQALPDVGILYGADHGEILTSPDSGMHGVYDGGQEQYHIPVYLAGQDHESYCRQADRLRQKNGSFSQLMEKYLLLEMMGYHLDPALLAKAQEHDLILHSDGQSYEYSQLPGTRHPALPAH